MQSLLSLALFATTIVFVGRCFWFLLLSLLLMPYRRIYQDTYPLSSLCLCICRIFKAYYTSFPNPLRYPVSPKFTKSTTMSGVSESTTTDGPGPAREHGHVRESGDGKVRHLQPVHVRQLHHLHQAVSNAFRPLLFLGVQYVDYLHRCYCDC